VAKHGRQLISRPHVLGIDDAPFRKGRDQSVPIVGVVMEGPDLIEAVAVATFAVDGDDAAGFLSAWVGGLRAYRSIQAILLGGITIAGLGVVDLDKLAELVARPVVAVTRRNPADSELRRALRAAGLTERLALLDRSPAAVEAAPGLFVAGSGLSPAEAVALVRRTLRKSRLPEPLRVAHMVAGALATGQSRGRV
jgi:endonuclease V-like protein UPF0215 family